MLLACTEGTTLTHEVCKKTELSCWISWFKKNETVCYHVLVGLIISKASVVHGIVCWWDWNVFRRFVFVLVIVSPFCRDIPWVEVDLATWATEKKTFSHFSLSFMYYFGVNLDCGRHTDHCSQVVAYAFITVMLQDRMLEMNSMTIQWLQKV